MKDFAKQINEKSRHRLKDLRTKLLLTYKQVDKGAQVTQNTVSRIEKGTVASSLDNIGAIILFYGFEYHEFFNFSKPLPDEKSLRSQMERFHRKHDSKAYEVIYKQPELIELVEHRLIANGVFDKWVTTADVEDYLTEHYNYSYENVSGTLLRAVNKRQILTFRKIKGSGRGGEQHEYKKLEPTDS